MSTKDISKIIRQVQLLENAAADKAGVRFVLLQEEKLLGKDRDAYIGHYIELVMADIAGEVLKAAGLGRELADAVRSAG